MPEAQPELVIFDLDGTLIDSIGDLADAMNAVLDRMGHPTHPRKDYRYFIGDGLEILARRTLPPEAIARTDIAEVVRLMRKEYATRWTATTRPFPGIRELLAELGLRSISTAVLSNKPDGPTRKIVSELFPGNPFAVVRGAVEDVPLKPDPTSSREILSQLGVRNDRAVFVGDTSIDMETGRNAGMRPVGVTWGFRTAQELVDAGADRIIDEPIDLIHFIEDEAPPAVQS